MFKNFAFATLLITSFAASANAVNVTPPATVTAATPATTQNQSPSAALNSLTPMAGDATTPPASAVKAAPAAAKPNYDTMTRAEKLKFINDKHAESVKKAELKWKSTSDDDKIAKYEKRRNSFMARRNAKANQQNASAAALNKTAPAAGISVGPTGSITSVPTTGTPAPEKK